MNSDEQRIRGYILQLCLCIVTCAVTALTFAAEDKSLHAAVAGRWEGTLAGPFRAQQVSWHFEVDAAGVLKGYMGPSSAGMPSVPMEKLVVTAEQVSFELPAQHGSFTGAVSAGGIAGTWRQGSALPLQMARKDFVFELPASAHAALVGVWEMLSPGATTSLSFGLTSGFNVERQDNAPLRLEFTETPDGKLSGVLSIPRSASADEASLLRLAVSSQSPPEAGSNRGRSFPLVDIFVTEEGFVQFATDNGRRFSGRLVNGALIGEYAGERGIPSRRSFLQPGRLERGFALTPGAEGVRKVEGRWEYNDIVLEIKTDAGTTRGQLLLGDGPGQSDPLVELLVDGNSFSYSTLAGRTFTGSIGADGIAGEYRVQGRPYQALFTRTAD